MWRLMLVTCLTIALPAVGYGQQAAQPDTKAAAIRAKHDLAAAAHVIPLREFEQFAPYWTAEAGWHTDLQLRNNLASDSLTVRASLRTPDGAETDLKQLTLLPGEVRSINLMDALADVHSNLAGHANAYGSIALRYTSKAGGNLYGSVMVHDTGHPIMYHLDAINQAPKYVAGSREGIWWLPTKGTRDYLVLTNQADHPLEGILRLYDSAGKSWNQPFQLKARQTQRLSVKEMVVTAGLSGQYGGIKVEVPDGAGSLDTSHLLYDEIAGFSATMKMFDYDPRAKIEERDYAGKGRWITRAPMLALQNPDPLLAFPSHTILEPMVLLRNTTAKRVKVNVGFHWRSAYKDGRASIPELTLTPFETRKIDVGELQVNGILPLDATWAQVTLTTGSLPDEVMAVATSYDATLRYGAQTPFSDQLIGHLEGGQWQVDASHTSLIAAGNGSDKAAKAALTIFYDQGRKQYRLEQTIAADDQWWVDIGQLIRNRTPDKNGSTLPVDLTSGAYQLREISDTRQDVLYEGKVVTDKIFGHATYGCMVCCGYGGDAGSPFLIEDPTGIFIQQSAPVDVYASNACSGAPDYVGGFFDTWGTNNTAIMTAVSASVTGVGVGSAIIRAHASYMPSGQGQGQRRACPQAPAQAEGGGQVAPMIMFTDQTQSINGTTQSAVVGQRIALSASSNLPSGYTMTSQSWTVPGTTVGGYTASSGSGVVTIADFTQQSTTFYWVDVASSRSVTYSINYNDSSGGSNTASATVTFNVTGPTAANVSTSGSLLPAIFGNSPISLGLGNGSIQGIPFSGSANANGLSGNFTFVNLLNSYSKVHRDLVRTCTSAFGPGLDGAYPYATGSSTNDSPHVPLIASDDELTVNFSATMYFMWQSAMASSIPIPLGSVAWSWAADAVQTNNVWSLASRSSSATFTANSSYPQWTVDLDNLSDSCN